MTLCTPCATIDINTCHRMYGYWSLKNSKDICESASNGCKGCQFFLTAIKGFLDSYNPRRFPYWVQEARPIRIRRNGWGHYSLSIERGDPYCVNIQLCATDQNGFDFPTKRGPKRLIPLDPNSPDVFELARVWLGRCSQHNSCDAQEDTPLPTRLIELTDNSELPLRICITQQDWRGKYVALSHCWGTGLSFTTNSQNLNMRTKGFRTESLPPSFRDAVILTQELGFKYLWIDALCIIQNNTEDWARESAAMTQVYHNATLMISANASPDSSCGILKRRSYLTSHSFGNNNGLQWQRWHPPTISPSFKTSADALVEPLDRRAWTYQEKIMAKRILYFREKEMAWGCSTYIYSESSGATPIENDLLHTPFNLDRPLFHHDSPSFKHGIHNFMRSKSLDVDQENPKLDLLQTRLRYWYNCIEEYTHRDLTNACDKLPALSGLGHGLSVPELGQYLAGLWEADLFGGLGWTYIDRDKIPVQEYQCYVAPSWSYMSGQGRVYFFDTITQEHGHLEYHPDEIWKQEFKPRLIDYHIKHDTSDHHGRITDGWLLIRAYYRRILVRRDMERVQDPFGDSRVAFDKRGGLYEWRFDSADGYHCPWLYEVCEPDDYGKPWIDDGGMEEYVAVQINQHERNFRLRIMLGSVLLILSPIEYNCEKAYKRVGILSVSLPEEQRYHEKWQTRDFKII